MSQISKRLRDLMRGKLAHSVKGFNAVFSAVATRDHLEPLSFTFTDGSNDFFQAQIDPALAENTTAVKYPFMTLYAIRADAIHYQKSQTFSGPVVMGLDVHLEHKRSRLSFDMESLADAVEETVVAVFNTTSNQQWDLETVYNGEISIQRYPLVIGGKENWRQTLRFLFKFEIHER